MAIFNTKSRELECKIVFYGPARCGKTTNFRKIRELYRRNIHGKIISIETDSDRTILLDYMPMGVGKIDGYHVKVQLYTVPGDVQYRSTRKVVLKGVDGIIFVADSLHVRREENIRALQDLRQNLEENEKSIFDVPMVLQYNKRDLEAQPIPLLTVEELESDLNRELKVPSYPSSAVEGKGVSDTLKACLKLTRKSLKEQMRQLEVQGEPGEKKDHSREGG
jgi:signal recognition particle receptor subunit beta